MVYVRGDFAEMRLMKNLAVLLLSSGVFVHSARAQDVNRLLEHAATSRVKRRQFARTVIQRARPSLTGLSVWKLPEVELGSASLDA